MANPIVVTQFAAPDPNASPLTVGQLVQLLNVLVSSEIRGSYTTYIIQGGTPSVDDQDKIWFELDTQGRPVAIKRYWNGNWRRVYNGMLGEIRMFSGDPGNTTNWDTDGLGKLGGIYDGWHICNGLGGTPDLSDKFIVGAHMNNDSGSGYQSGNWVSNVTGTFHHSGGRKEFTLTADTTYRAAAPQVNAYLWSANANAPDGGGDLFGLKNASTSEHPLYDSAGSLLPTSDAGNTSPDPVNIINPYIALGYIVFVGYSP